MNKIIKKHYSQRNRTQNVYRIFKKAKKVYTLRFLFINFTTCKQTNKRGNMKQFTMTLEDSEFKRKKALSGVTHKEVYLEGLKKLESDAREAKVKKS